MKILDLDPTEFTGLAAMAALEVSIEQAARLLQTELGFGSCDSSTPFETFQQLCLAYDHSLRTGEPLPVYVGDLETSVYTDDDTEVAYRYWRQVCHVRRGLSFSLADRIELALGQLAVLERAGFTRGCEVYALFEADTIGRLLSEQLSGFSPRHPGEFVTTCIEAGLSAGLLSELRVRR